MSRAAISAEFFAYDQHMNPSVLAAVGVKPLWIESARLEGFLLAPRAGGVTLRQSAGSVYGAFVRLTETDAQSFIEANGAEHAVEAVCTLLADRRSVACLTFIHPSTSEKWDPAVLKEIAAASADWRHPKRYLEWLTSLARRDARRR